MKRRSRRALFGRGAIGCGIGAVLLLTIATGFIVNNKISAEESHTYDFEGISRLNATKLSITPVFSSAKKPYEDEATGMKWSAQSMAITNGYFDVILTLGKNYENGKNNKIRRYDLSVTDRNNSNYQNPNLSPNDKYTYSLGHANGATYNERTGELLVATYLQASEKKGQVSRFSTTSGFKQLNSSYYWTDGENNRFQVQGIAYGMRSKVGQSWTDYYYTSAGTSIRKMLVVDGVAGKVSNLLTMKYEHVVQDLAYYNGYIYRPAWAGSKKVNGVQEDRTGNFEKNDSVIYQFGTNGTSTGVFYVKNTDAPCEIESMAFYEGVPYVLYNGCRIENGKLVKDNGYYAVAKITSSNDYRSLYHSFTINYDANEGSWSGAAPSAETAYVGVEKAITNSKPTREGYTFLGWSTSRGAETAKYESGLKYKIKDYKSVDYYEGYLNVNTKDVTLYAVWREHTYKIYYFGNGGKDAPSDQTVVKSENAVLSSSIPTRDGYEFLGWSTSSTATTATYQPGDTYTDRMDLKLYAVWKANVYNIFYNPRGGTGGLDRESFNVTDDARITTRRPTRNGYRFLGWSTSSTTNTVTYTGGEAYTGRSDLYLFAVWELEYYTVSFDANGGTNAPSTIRMAKTINSITLPKNIPTRSGFKFKGWGTTADTTAVTYAPGSNYTECKNITLYAIWEEDSAPVTSVYLFFDANGGSNAPDTIAMTSGAAGSIPSDALTRDGYSFQGWSLTSGDNNTVNYNVGDSITITNNTVLYAVWNVDNIWLNYDANGGVGAPERRGGLVGQITVSSNVPTREGYTFDGWGINNSSSVVYYPGDSYEGSESATLRAIWSENTVAINYNVKGGSNGPGIQYGAPNHCVVLSAMMPTRGNANFLGWSLSSADGSSVDYVSGEEICLQDSNISLYAVWDTDWYVVVLNANGAENDTPDSIVTDGEDVVIPNNDLRRNGYRFIGWSTSEDATEVQYTAGDTYDEGTSVILYAVWVVDSESSTDSSDDVFDDYDDYEDELDDFDDDSRDDQKNPKTSATRIIGIMGLSAVFISGGMIVLVRRRR